MKTTETLDKMYLEWSQFTSARTEREIVQHKLLRVLRARLATGQRTEVGDGDLVETIDDVVGAFHA